MIAGLNKLVIASNNQKKRKEIEAILKDLNISVVPASETVFIDVVEDGLTFAENAKKKAFAFMQANSCSALADDSGLCVDGLNGAPGVFSARFAGEHASDEQNNQKLINALEGLNERSAHFSCALCLVLPNGAEVTAEGSVDGKIIDSLSGDQGFGYDPLFFSTELGKTFAQSTPEEKASVSHRGRALRLLKKKLKS